MQLRPYICLGASVSWCRCRNKRAWLLHRQPAKTHDAAIQAVDRRIELVLARLAWDCGTVGPPRPKSSSRVQKWLDWSSPKSHDKRHALRLSASTLAMAREHLRFMPPRSSFVPTRPFLAGLERSVGAMPTALGRPAQATPGQLVGAVSGIPCSDRLCNTFPKLKNSHHMLCT